MGDPELGIRLIPILGRHSILVVLLFIPLFLYKLLGGCLLGPLGGLFGLYGDGMIGLLVLGGFTLLGLELGFWAVA